MIPAYAKGFQASDSLLTPFAIDQLRALRLAYRRVRTLHLPTVQVVPYGRERLGTINGREMLGAWRFVTVWFDGRDPGDEDA